MSKECFGLFALVALTGVSLVTTGARADEAAPAADVKPSAADAEAADGEAAKEEKASADKGKKPLEPEEEEDEDGVRFRGGISGGGGAMIFATSSSFGGTYNLGIGGVDGRIGVQINDLIGVYAQPQVGIYGGGLGVGGLAGGALVVDFTFFDQLFVGVGGGGAILNNPAAGEVIVRVGGYPAFGLGENGIRRKGLMIGIDLRIFIAPTGADTLIAPSPTLNIGYEAY